MILRSLILGVGLLVISARVEAYPLLQLDIIGGTYDPVTQTTISSGPDFTLIALLSPRPTDNLAALLNDTYYISAALMPKVGPTHSALGSFTWNGTNYNGTGDMTFGTPPMESLGATFDSGDLNDPNIFPTFFREFAFQFSFDQRALPKYIPLDAGSGVTPTSATGNVSYFQTFNITTAFAGNNVLHFNLYDTYIKRCSWTATCVVDLDIEHFSNYDGQSVNHSVPEPSGMALMSLGLVFAVRRLRGARRK